MSEKIDIWLVGNTGLRNPNRIQEGFSVFASSPYVGNLRGRDNEIGFMRLLKHRLTRAHREKQLKMSCQALHNAPPNRT